MKIRSWSDLGRSWGGLGRSWGDLGRSWGAVGRSWRDLGWSWSALGRLLGRSWSLLGPPGVVLGGSWGALGRSKIDKKIDPKIDPKSSRIATEKNALELRLYWFQSLTKLAGNQIQADSKSIETVFEVMSSYICVFYIAFTSV